MRVGATGHAELVGVVAAGVLHGDAIFQGLPGEAAVNVIDAAVVWRKTEQSTEHLIAGVFVSRRQQGMGFGLSLDLLDFDQALVAVARGGPGRIDGSSEAVEVHGIHPAVAQVGVMRNGQQLVACLALRVHPFPQVFGMPGVQHAEWQRRHLGTIAEEDVAVQIAIVKLGGVLVRAECSELAGMIIRVGDLDVFLPGAARHFGAHKSLDRRLAGEREEIEEDLLLLRGVVGVLQN